MYFLYKISNNYTCHLFDIPRDEVPDYNNMITYVSTQSQREVGYQSLCSQHFLFGELHRHPGVDAVTFWSVYAVEERIGRPHVDAFSLPKDGTASCPEVREGNEAWQRNNWCRQSSYHANNQLILV